ncbi:MAG: YicC family protein [Ignavibacteria bacterium]|nr:YicC family protein [Ignavibacteria bacterium]
MIISMTGYGRASAQSGKLKMTAEVRGINSKYLEISVKLPQLFAEREQELRQFISGKMSRGKVSVSFSLDGNGEDLSTLKIKPEIVRRYARLIRSVMKEAGIKEKLKAEHLLNFTDLFKREDQKSYEKYWNKAMVIIMKAFNNFQMMRLREGRVLQKDILKRLSYIDSKLKKTELISKRSLQDTKNNIASKVSKLTEELGISVDKGRLEYELVMISDRLDVTEEVTRTLSHLDYFRKSIKSKEPSGRKLNFLVQEINREINTIASKSSNSKISQFVVEMKEELEKIKEQLQNIE